MNTNESPILTLTICGGKKMKRYFLISGLENNTHLLVFSSASGCRASENFDISGENHFFPICANNICDAGQVPI